MTELIRNFYLIFLEDSFFLLFLKKITPFILTFIFLLIFLKKYKSFFKKFILIFSLIFFFIICYSMILRFINYEKINIDNQNVVKNNKVIWLILDEFDPHIAFKKDNNLKNFENLMNRSFLS